MCYLEGQSLQDYLHDMELCQSFAMLNRQIMVHTISVGMSWSEQGETFSTLHNYIDLKDNIIRKGAISTHTGEKLLIPLNMRDGCILGVGKGNEDWNYSAPHGAGRKMSRSQAKAKGGVEEFKKIMKGIYSTTINKDTLDEAPFAYKPAKEIIELVKDTVDIISILKPIYNFKACE